MVVVLLLLLLAQEGPADANQRTLQTFSLERAACCCPTILLPAELALLHWIPASEGKNGTSTGEICMCVVTLLLSVVGFFATGKTVLSLLLLDAWGFFIC